MAKTMLRLPIGIQDFESLRIDGYTYIDKTEYVYRLVNEGRYYFLSRPRRFGKSLLLSTIKALFLLPLWALGAIPVAIGTGIVSGLAPIWGQILSFVLQAAVLVGVFCGVYKLVFPNRKLTELFKKKNRRWLLLGAVAVTGLNFILSAAWPGWSILRVILMTAGGFCPIDCEWWHFTLENEPFPDTYFEFPVSTDPLKR